MTDLPSRIDTVVIGAGQAGLAASALLTKAGSAHVVLERRGTLGGGWQDRWDAFRLVSPNWTTSLPGYAYEGDHPDGYMPRDEVVARIAGYAAATDAPVRLGTAVTRLERADGHPGFRLATGRGRLEANRVIVATGGFQVPRIPPVGSHLPARIVQLHSHAYRNPGQLPDGTVVVVGSAQSGVQIAEELHEAGRSVVLSVGHCGRMPRRYRGRDIFHWLADVRAHGGPFSVSLPTTAELDDPGLRFACNPHLSGHRGGHDTDLRRMAADGIRLVGRLDGVDGDRLRLASDLDENLRFADAFFDDRLRARVDTYIERAAIDAPPDDREPFAFDPPEPTELDLTAENISTVIWATGYRLDFGWIDLPIFDAQGFPIQDRGVSAVPGLGFLGVPWMVDQVSATLFGVGTDAARLVDRLGSSASA